MINIKSSVMRNAKTKMFLSGTDFLLQLKSKKTSSEQKLSGATSFAWPMRTKKHRQRLKKLCLLKNSRSRDSNKSGIIFFQFALKNKAILFVSGQSAVQV